MGPHHVALLRINILHFLVCVPPLIHRHSFLPFFFFKVKLMYIEMHKSQLNSFDKWMHLHNPHLDGNLEYFHLPRKFFPV